MVFGIRKKVSWKYSMDASIDIYILEDYTKNY